MKLKILLTGGILWALSSCKIGQPYEREVQNLPENFRNQTVKDSLNVARISWKRFFNDATLLRLIDTALHYNISLSMAEKDVRMAEEQLFQRKANFFPSVRVDPEFYGENHSKNRYSSPNGKYYSEKTAPDFMFVSRRQYLFPVQSSWEADIWGKLKRMKEGAAARLEADRESLRALQTTLVAEVAITYYNLLVLDEQMTVANTNLELTRSTLELTRLQFKAGMVTSLAIQQTENQLLTATALIPKIKREILQEENYLKSLMGQYPGEIERSRKLEDVRFSDNVFTGTPIDLLRNRPDIIAAEYDLLAAYADADVARAQRYPTLALESELGFDSQVFGVLFNPMGSLFSTFSASLLQPLFQNRKLKTAQNIAEIQKEKVGDAFRATLLRAVREVSDEVNNIQKLEEEYQIAQERLANAKTAVQNASLLFKSGMANYLEVISAQSNALNNEIDLYNIRLDILTANIELYRKLGGGWK